LLSNPKKIVVVPHSCLGVEWVFITKFQNFFVYFIKEFLLAVGVWTDEFDRILLCEIEDGVFGNMELFFFKENLNLKHINDVINNIVQAAIYMQFK
jgi:hypothetical protein